MLHRWKQSFETTEILELVFIIFQELYLLELLSLGIECLFICFIDADYAFLVDIFEQSNDLVLLLDCGVDQIESIMHKILLYFSIKCCIAIEGRSMIHFQQPRLARLVYKDIEAKDFKAHVVVNVAGLASSVMMIQIRLDRYQRLHEDITHLCLQLLDINSIPRELHKDALKSSFMTCRRISSFICFKIGIILVDCIIREMYEWIVVCLQLVLFCRKSGQAISECKYSQRLHVGHQNVNSEIKLVVVNQIGVFDILLDDQMLRHINLVKTLGDEDSLALRKGFWLHDEVGSRIGCAIVFQIFKLMRKKPSFWEKLKICWKLLKHTIEVPSEVVFPSNLIHPRKVVDFLKWLHVLPPVQWWCDISPLNIPFYPSIPGVPVAQLPIKVIFSNVSNDVILGIVNVENNPLWLHFHF